MTLDTIALYARVSTAQQEKQGTIESQIAALDAYAAAHGLAIAPEHRYIDDGYSGARLDRPGLERLRDAAWRGELDRVLILSPDRLARHYAYQYVVVEELERAGCAVIFVTGSFVATPEERLVREVHGLFAEFERAALQERSRRGKLHAARQGAFFTGAGPYGYTYLPAHDGQLSRCVVNEAEATIVRQMFTWLVEEQLSTAAVAKRLTTQGVPTRRGHVPWSPASVYKILNNRAYTGTHYYNRSMNAPEGGRDGAHLRRPTKDPRRCLRPSEEWIAVPWPTIISEEVFVMAQRQLQLNRERSPRKTKVPYLLSGLLYCGYCGRRLGGHAGVASGRYECTRRRPTEPPDRRCRLRSVSQPDIEPLVWGHIARLLQRPDLIVDYLRQQQEGEGPDLTDAQRELKRLQRQRATLAREEQRLIDAYQVGAVELDELKERRQRLREAGQQVDQRVHLVKAQMAQAQQAARVTETVVAFCTRLKAQLAEPSFALKQRILRLVVERIVVTDDEILIQHIIPGEDTSRLYLRPSRARKSPGGPRTGTTLE
jgi:site-specific DNA recombinase